MRVLDARRRLGEKLQEAALEKDADSLALALDYGRAILLALAPLADDEEVELPEVTVNTTTAARILSLHVEYVRELIRRDVLPGTKHNNEYEIKLTDVMEFMSSPRFRAGGWPVRPKTAVAMFGPIWRWPRADLRPGSEPESP
ncbi:MAG TPA: helix-turn-helix domain-containing protein [Dehalococcoidia bacterium]|nr:helix-turn-helix domain-containing protein [Dehalococcoidia bacterium]